MSIFGDRLRTFREAKRLSQERLGFELGVSKATISKWENGKGEPGLGQLATLREFFSDSIGSLDELICAPSGPSRVAEAVASYETSPRVAVDVNEVTVLAAYRALSPKRQRALLDLLSSE